MTNLEHGGSNAPVHRMHDRKTPIGHLVICSCGYSTLITRQNALARAAKVRKVIRKHLEGCRP